MGIPRWCAFVFKNTSDVLLGAKTLKSMHSIFRDIHIPQTFFLKTSGTANIPSIPRDSLGPVTKVPPSSACHPFHCVHQSPTEIVRPGQVVISPGAPDFLKSCLLVLRQSLLCIFIRFQNLVFIIFSRIFPRS